MAALCRQFTLFKLDIGGVIEIGLIYVSLESTKQQLSYTYAILCQCEGGTCRCQGRRSSRWSDLCTNWYYWPELKRSCMVLAALIPVLWIVAYFFLHFYFMSRQTS